MLEAIGLMLGVFGFLCFLVAVVSLRSQVVRQNMRLHHVIAPILRHADAHEFAPPISFSVDDCRRIKREVERKTAYMVPHVSR